MRSYLLEKAVRNSFFRSTASQTLGLFLEANGTTPDLYLYDAAGTTRAALNLYDSGVPNLEFRDTPDGVSGPSILLESTQEGKMRFAFRDFRMNSARILGALEFSLIGNRPRLDIMDASGKHIWRMP